MSRKNISFNDIALFLIGSSFFLIAYSTLQNNLDLIMLKNDLRYPTQEYCFPRNDMTNMTTGQISYISYNKEF